MESECAIEEAEKSSSPWPLVAVNLAACLGDVVKPAELVTPLISGGNQDAAKGRGDNARFCNKVSS